MKRPAATIVAILSFTSIAMAGEIRPRDGWQVIDTKLAFAELSGRLDTAIKDNKMGLVTSASASEGAKAQGFTIPGNRVVGVFRNDFARRMLAASVPAGIEAPIRFYLVENADGSTTLAYKKPSMVFAAYASDAKPDLKAVSTELDAIFEKIATDATKP